MAKPPPPKKYLLHIPDAQEQRLLQQLKATRKKRVEWLREAIEEKLDRSEVEL